MIRTLILISVLAMTASALAKDPIRPSATFPFYWEFRGQTAPLIGGSSEDNLYQAPDMEAELQRLAKAGANYVRCSMSSRDGGNLWGRPPSTIKPRANQAPPARRSQCQSKRIERFKATPRRTG